MKKIATIIIMLLAVITASAQTWEKESEEANIVKGTPKRDFYTLTIDSITSIKVYADTDEWYLTRLNKKKRIQNKISKIQY